MPIWQSEGYTFWQPCMFVCSSHGYRYEMSNCLFESAFENILKECKCFPGKIYKYVFVQAR